MAQQLFGTTLDNCYSSSHISQGLDGAEIIVNGSGSYHQLRKKHIIADLVRSATYKVRYTHHVLPFLIVLGISHYLCSYSAA